MKLQAARPYQIRSVVDHVGLVFATVGSGTASVASIDIAELCLALFVAVVLADMKLFIAISENITFVVGLDEPGRRARAN